jgi:hypothetical protein
MIVQQKPLKYAVTDVTRRSQQLAPSVRQKPKSMSEMGIFRQ